MGLKIYFPSLIPRQTPFYKLIIHFPQAAKHVVEAPKDLHSAGRQTNVVQSYHLERAVKLVLTIRVWHSKSLASLMQA